MFWKLAKKTDSRSHDSFDAEFSNLVNYIRESAMRINKHTIAPKVFNNAMNWLQHDLFAKRFQWAYRFTFSVMKLTSGWVTKLYYFIIQLLAQTGTILIITMNRIYNCVYINYL